MITYLKGDATQPVGDGCKIIIHICNDIGMWGAGFTKSLSKHYPKAEEVYRERFSSSDKECSCLGMIQFVDISDEIKVINLIAQKGVRTPWNPVPVDYAALNEGEHFVMSNNRSIHMPRIGCGLAGGSWDQIEPMIQRHFILNDVPAFVYDL